MKYLEKAFPSLYIGDFDNVKTGLSFASMNPIINMPIMPSINPSQNQTKADLFLLLAIAAQPKAQASQMITTPKIIATSISISCLI